MPPSPIPVEGHCDARFGAVRDAFRRNFEVHGEVGATVCVRVGGKVVVDLWGGYQDEGRSQPWREDTLVNAYSVGKGVTALLALRLVEQGMLDLDAPVTGLWPEYAVKGKESTTLRMLLSHRGGQPGVREVLPEGAQLAWSRMTQALARQAPFWEPDSDHGYHVNSYGYLVGELIRRAAGLRVGEALAHSVAGPLGADFFIGLPTSQHARVAETLGPGSNHLPTEIIGRYPEPTGDAAYDLMQRHAYFNPPGISGMGCVNTASWREAEIPSTNGQATARGVATIYQALLDGAKSPAGIGAELLAEATRIHSDGTDRMLGRPSRFGLGFQLTQPSRPLGPNPNAFGHYGYGGSLGFADPTAGVAFGYLMNLPGARWQNPRTEGLVEAVYASF
jgi:CubicO group peptidase (beta-lactamase class C family)